MFPTVCGQAALRERQQWPIRPGVGDLLGRTGVLTVSNLWLSKLAACIRFFTTFVCYREEVTFVSSDFADRLGVEQDQSFRVFSTIQDQQSKELSQGHVKRRAKRLKVREAELKLPRVTGIASCEVGAQQQHTETTFQHKAVNPLDYQLLLPQGSLGRALVCGP